jgi:hypothetical protein
MPPAALKGRLMRSFSAYAWRVRAGHWRPVPLSDRPRSEVSAGWTRDGKGETGQCVIVALSLVGGGTCNRGLRPNSDRQSVWALNGNSPGPRWRMYSISSPSLSPIWLRCRSAGPTGCLTRPALTVCRLPGQRSGGRLRAHPDSMHPGLACLTAQEAGRAREGRLNRDLGDAGGLYSKGLDAGRKLRLAWRHLSSVLAPSSARLKEALEGTIGALE